MIPFDVTVGQTKPWTDAEYPHEDGGGADIDVPSRLVGDAPAPAIVRPLANEICESMADRSIELDNDGALDESVHPAATDNSAEIISERSLTANIYPSGCDLDNAIRYGGTQKTRYSANAAAVSLSIGRRGSAGESA